MEPLVAAFIVVMAAGVIIAGICNFAAFIMLWWVAIPLFFLMIGGPIGFLFGFGLVAIFSILDYALNR